MYKLEIGVMAENDKTARDCIKYIYKNCIDNNKDRSVDYNWCICDGIRYVTIPNESHFKGRHLDQIIFCNFVPTLDYFFDVVEPMLSKSCVPWNYLIQKIEI